MLLSLVFFQKNEKNFPSFRIPQIIFRRLGKSYGVIFQIIRAN
jgi:hypothetical protein